YSIYRLLYSFLLILFTIMANTEIYSLSLHDALPICTQMNVSANTIFITANDQSNLGVRLKSFQTIDNVTAHLFQSLSPVDVGTKDRKSTRLNSSHVSISYAVFCLKKKNIRYSIYISE